MTRAFGFLVALTSIFTPAVYAGDLMTQAIESAAALKWNRPQEPARIYGNTYYAGVAGLSSVLVQTDAGLILLDGDLPQSVPLIESNIRKLGFKVENIKFILNSHAHFDHAGGIAALAHDSGAVTIASPSGAQALRTGRTTPDDPQAGDGADTAIFSFPAVTGRVREVRNGEVLKLGATEVTAYFTPGHTPGSTTWTWKSCENNRCLNVVYADSLNPISAPHFHFLADKNHGDLTATFRKSIQTVATLSCDILISVHPEVAKVDTKLEQLRSKPTTNPFIDPQACRDYAAYFDHLLDERITEEKAALKSAPTTPSHP